jgi:hypothetical protein
MSKQLKTPETPWSVSLGLKFNSTKTTTSTYNYTNSSTTTITKTYANHTNSGNVSNSHNTNVINFGSNNFQAPLHNCIINLNGARWSQ